MLSSLLTLHLFFFFFALHPSNKRQNNSLHWCVTKEVYRPLALFLLFGCSPLQLTIHNQLPRGMIKLANTKITKHIEALLAQTEQEMEIASTGKHTRTPSAATPRHKKRTNALLLDPICGVCRSLARPLFQCHLCGVHVHPGCYELKEYQLHLNSIEWVCDPCWWQSMYQHQLTNPRCLLCTNEGGSLISLL